MHIHPRESVVNAAEAKLGMAVAQIYHDHELTYGELYRILNTVQDRYIKYQIRDERHPDEPGKPGGLL